MTKMGLPGMGGEWPRQLKKRRATRASGSAAGRTAGRGGSSTGHAGPPRTPPGEETASGWGAC